MQQQTKHKAVLICSGKDGIYRRQVSCLGVAMTLLLIYCVLYCSSTQDGEDNKQT